MLSCVGPVEVSTAAAIVKKSSHGGLLIYCSPHQCNHTKSIFCNTFFKGSPPT